MTNHDDEYASMELICSRCTKRFTWTPSEGSLMPPLYHSISCRKRQGKHRAMLSEGRPDLAGKCTRPDKKVFEDTRKAWDWIEEHHPDDQIIHPYVCMCGELHIGHHNKVD